MFGGFLDKSKYEKREKARLKQFETKFGLDSDDLEELPIHYRNGKIYYYHYDTQKVYEYAFASKDQWKILGYATAYHLLEKHKLLDEYEIEEYDDGVDDPHMLPKPDEIKKTTSSAVPSVFSRFTNMVGSIGSVAITTASTIATSVSTTSTLKPKSRPLIDPNLSDYQKEMFKNIFGKSSDCLKKIGIQYRDASTHYYDPVGKHIYSLTVGKWNVTTNAALQQIANDSGLEISLSDHPTLNRDDINAIYLSALDKIAGVNTENTKCVGGTTKMIYIYKLPTRGTQQYCTFCKENCIKLGSGEKWEDKKLSTGYFDCTCGDCNCEW